MMTKTIIFDYDGTIHHTLGIYEPAFRETYQWLTEQKAAEEREIGGLGIYIVKKSMDEVLYRYEDGQNILTIRKAF